MVKTLKSENKAVRHGTTKGGVGRVAGTWWHECKDGSTQEKFDSVPACHYCGTLRREVVRSEPVGVGHPVPKPERQPKGRHK